MNRRTTIPIAMLLCSVAACGSSSRPRVSGHRIPSAAYAPTLGCDARADPVGWRFPGNDDLQTGGMVIFNAGMLGRRTYPTADGHRSATPFAIGVRAGHTLKVGVLTATRGTRIGFRDRTATADGSGESYRGLTFKACRQNTPKLDGHGTVGPYTTFMGGMLDPEPTCLRLLVSDSDGAAVKTTTVPLAVQGGVCA